MQRRILGCFLLLLATGCGKSLDQQLKESIRNLDNANLKKSDVEILSVQQNGEQAIAEVKIKTAFKLRKEGERWHLEEVRLGDRNWQQADVILEAINRQRVEETRSLLSELRKAIEAYRSDQGELPQATDFSGLVDQLNPRYLQRVIRLDAWSRSFAFDLLSDQQYDLRSAGQDGAFRTPDDILPPGDSR